MNKRLYISVNHHGKGLVWRKFTHVAFVIACVFWFMKMKTTQDWGRVNNGSIPEAFQCKWYLVRVHFTARPSRRANLDERNRNNNKSAVRAKKARMRDAFRAKATDKNLTAEWRPDCSNSLSSQVFYLSAQRERPWQRQPTHPFWFQPRPPTPLLYQIYCS